MASLIRRTPTGLLTAYPVYDRGESYPFLATQPDLFRGGGTCTDDHRPADDGGGECVTLLGDAAHPMSPFKAQGANQALIDAVHLADSLGDALSDACSTSSSISASLRAFERQMYARTERQRLRSRAAVEALHSADVRVAAATGKDGAPSEELMELFRSARIGCWDAETTARRGSQTELERKVREARKVVRRRATRQRVQRREAAS